MLKEGQPISSIERELRFRSWCETAGVNLWAFDLDGTICDTRGVFRQAMSRTYDFLNLSIPTVLRGEWETVVENINDRLFEQYGVNPKRWIHVVDELAQKYGLAEAISFRAKEILASIYTTPVDWAQGAEAGLQFIKRAGGSMGIVTHAGHEWTWMKYNWLALYRFVDWDDVFLVDENSHKTTKSWQEAFRFMDVHPNEVAVVGDSPRSDINPALEAGVKHCFLVETDLWSVHNQPVGPQVIKIRQLTEIPDRVI